VPLRVAFDAARAHLEGVLTDLDPVSPDVEVVGTSGTVESAQAVLVANGWSQRTITAVGLGHLVDALFDGRWNADAGLLGLAPDRVDIFPPGIALLDALFRRMGIASMRYVDAALEDGVLYAMIDGDDAVADVRQATVRGLQQRFGVDVGQARRVRETALALFDQTCAGWPVAAADPDWRALLAAAAELHELGLAVSPKAHHRHGAYLLRHAELQGFSGSEREYLALLVRGHRRRLPVLAFSSLGQGERRPLLRLAALLRLAVILERSYADAHSTHVRAVASSDTGGDRLLLCLPRGWLEGHPLSRHELADEPYQLAGAGIRLELAEV
jgi:exopolyphosphatase/guanosine-5'-triphosphate,3'-diphosphate pyrophosphatase